MFVRGWDAEIGMMNVELPAGGIMAMSTEAAVAKGRRL